MYNNIGGKIKVLAKVIAYIGIGISIIYGLILMVSISWLRSGMGSIPGLLVILLGSLGSWIGSFILYGFGELIENTARIADAQEIKHTSERLSRIQDRYENEA